MPLVLVQAGQQARRVAHRHQPSRPLLVALAKAGGPHGRDVTGPGPEHHDRFEAKPSLRRNQAILLGQRLEPYVSTGSRRASGAAP
jgi:hypothetical protein